VRWWSIPIAAGVFVLAHAQERDPTLTITINPEARVSVKRTGELPPAAACGRALEVPVAIVNQGRITAGLEATLVDSVPAGVTLEFAADPLQGTADESRLLRLTLTSEPVVDVTIAFRAKHDKPDLGGRDRVHLLVRCR
jgi:hypothetical protein